MFVGNGGHFLNSYGPGLLRVVLNVSNRDSFKAKNFQKKKKKKKKGGYGIYHFFTLLFFLSKLPLPLVGVLR